MKVFALAGLALLLVPVANAPVAAQSIWQGYQLGAEDQIEVQIHGQGGATIKTRIKSDGSITLPLVGRTQAENQTTQGLASAIEAQLKRGGMMTNPIVNVEILEYASNTVTMLGEFTNPGIVPLDRPLNLTDVVARVGGLKQNASDNVALRRKGGAVEHYSLSAMARNEAHDIVLQPGDVLFATAAPQYYIYGQVGNAGTFAIAPQMTIRQALARAGGPTLAGSERKITLYRDRKESDADLSALIQPGDVLFVRERVF